MSSYLKIGVATGSLGYYFPAWAYKRYSSIRIIVFYSPGLRTATARSAYPHKLTESLKPLKLRY